jgi:hypothetical protein
VAFCIGLTIRKFSAIIKVIIIGLNSDSLPFFVHFFAVNGRGLNKFILKTPKVITVCSERQEKLTSDKRIKI